MHTSNETILFADNLAAPTDTGWSWLRETPSSTRIQDNALEIRVEPGLADTVKNALVRTIADRANLTYAIEVTVTNHTAPTQQYEQAGITWYVDGKPVFKEVIELIDGDLYIIPGRKPIAAKRVRLRLIVTADTWSAQFRPEGETEFQTADTGDLPPPGNDQVSIQCYNGPEGKDHWIRFEHFCIKKLPATKKR